MGRAGIVLLGCRYDVILRVALESRFKVMSESEPWSLCWSDMPLLPEKIVELKQNGVGEINQDSLPLVLINLCYLNCSLWVALSVRGSKSLIISPQCMKSVERIVWGGI